MTRAALNVLHLRRNRTHRTLCDERAGTVPLATDVTFVTCDACKRILAKPGTPPPLTPVDVAEDAARQERLEAAARSFIDVAAAEGLPVDFTKHRCGLMGRPRVELAVYLPPLRRGP